MEVAATIDRRGDESRRRRSWNEDLQQLKISVLRERARRPRSRATSLYFLERVPSPEESAANRMLVFG